MRRSPKRYPVRPPEGQGRSAGGARRARLEVPSRTNRLDAPDFVTIFVPGGQRMESNRWKAWLAGAGVALALLLLAAGYALGHAPVDSVRAEAAEAQEAAERRIREAEDHAAEATRQAEETRAETEAVLAAVRDRLRLLEARRFVARALDDLDARNFGLSQARCQEAAATLGRDGGPPEGLEELMEGLRTFRFEMSGDFDASRQELRAFAAQLDAALEEPAEPAEPFEPNEPFEPSEETETEPSEETEPSGETEPSEETEPGEALEAVP
jgi:hypothetical protein